MLSPADLALSRRLRAAGIKMPLRMLIACKQTGLPRSLAAALLLQESGGGVNEWGHDEAAGEIIFPGRPGVYLVTRANVTGYLRTRSERGNQGCGVTQLTSPGLQDEATRRGGLWKPLVQMQVGFGDMAALIRRYGMFVGVMAYNGSGPAAEAYARQVIAEADRIAAATGLPKVG